MSTFVVLLIGVLSLTIAEEQTQEFYPERWTQIDGKKIIDNERLFKKYKQCFLEETNVGCPSEVLEIKKVIPEMIETLCAKCSPAFVKASKETLSYACKTRKEDYDELKAKYDPDGSIYVRVVDKFGPIEC